AITPANSASLSRSGHLGFSSGALKRASKVHQSSVLFPPAAVSGGTRVRGVTARICCKRGSFTAPSGTHLCACAPALLRFIGYERRGHGELGPELVEFVELLPTSQS